MKDERAMRILSLIARHAAVASLSEMGNDKRKWRREIMWEWLMADTSRERFPFMWNNFADLFNNNRRNVPHRSISIYFPGVLQASADLAIFSKQISD